jgi:hypothetical protein
MTRKVNWRAVQHARSLIERRRVVLDDRDAWRAHRPTARQRDAYIRANGIRAYGTWFLAIDDQAPEGTKARHKFPYGDFQSVHRCAVLSAEQRAGQYRYSDLELAAAQLHRMLDELTWSRAM